MKKILVIIAVLFYFSISAIAAPKNPVVIMKTTFGEIEIELFKDEAPITVDNFIALAEGKKEFTDINGKKVKKHYYDGLIFHRVIENFMIQGGDLTGTGSGNPGFTLPDEINAKYLGLDKLKAFEEGRPHQYLGIRNQKEFNQRLIAPLAHKLNINNQEEFKKRNKEVMDNLMKLTLMGAYENLGYKYTTKFNSTKPVRGVIAMANIGPDSGGSQFFINVVDADWLAGKHTVFGKVTKGMQVVDKIVKVKVNANGKPVKDIKIISVRLKK